MNIQNLKLIDLTHTLSSETPQWNIGCGFHNHIILDYADVAMDTKFRVQKLDMFAGSGTHMDAPAHCIPDAETIDHISLKQLFAPCVVIDVSSKADENYRVIVEDVCQFEKKYGAIPNGAFIIVYTGWERFWHQPEKFRNNLIFPSVSREAAELLLTKKIVGIGIDTLSPDRADSGFPVHQLVLSAGKYIIENIANAKQLPPQGAYIMALPIKIQGGTEAPIRLIAMV